jgi:hypothetical protein
MNTIYEAAVLTTGGTFRAYNITEQIICVTEDGTDGVIDFIHKDGTDGTIAAPETLVPTLVGWLWEMRRGLDIITATLTSRNN